MNFNPKIASVALLAAVGVAANAATFNIQFQSRGNYATSGSPVMYSADDNSAIKAYTNASYSPAGYKATDLMYAFTPIFATATSTTGTESNGHGTLTLLQTTPGGHSATIDFAFTGTVSRTISPWSVSFSHMALTFSNGTGWLHGFTGTGALSSNLTTIGGKRDQTTFNANLQAVPEPSSFAVMGIGLIGAIRRRRNKR